MPRAPIIVNPVTGAQSAAPPMAAGMLRDGSLAVPAKMIDAARDLGLGGAGGRMYAHVSALVRAGGDDLPTTSTRGALDRNPRVSGAGSPASAPRLSSSMTASAVKSEVERASSSGGRGTRIHGLGSTARAMTSGAGGSAFARQRGVVNTARGARNLRVGEADFSHSPISKAQAAPVGTEQRAIATMASLDPHAASGKARRAAIAAAAAAARPSSAHASVRAPRPPTLVTGFPRRGTVGVVASAPLRRAGGSGGAGPVASKLSVEPPLARRESSAPPSTVRDIHAAGPSNALPAKSGSAIAPDMTNIAAKRAMFFRAQAAEAAERAAASAAILER